jgi:poly-beta-1,6-N-acetyl-D-glucosamine synthase
MGFLPDSRGGLMDGAAQLRQRVDTDISQLHILSSALVNPFFLLGYLVDVPAVMVPVLYQAARRHEAGKALASLPAFFALRTVNSYYILKALWLEVVMRRRLNVYEKGH